jgi:hypothetical protein
MRNEPQRTQRSQRRAGVEEFEAMKATQRKREERI